MQVWKWSKYLVFHTRMISNSINSELLLWQLHCLHVHSGIHFKVQDCYYYVHPQIIHLQTPDQHYLRPILSVQDLIAVPTSSNALLLPFGIQNLKKFAPLPINETFKRSLKTHYSSFTTVLVNFTPAAYDSLKTKIQHKISIYIDMTFEVLKFAAKLL